MKSTGETICSRAALATVLPSSSSSLLLIPAQNEHPPCLVMGTINGEIHFATINDDRHGSSRVQLKSSSPVTSLSQGSLTGQSTNELVAICADGFTQCIVPPSSESKEDAVLVFSQVIQANVTSSHIVDVDKDGQQELVVFMTDRVVRTFRWSTSDSRLLPIRKWEVPCQISAISLGEPGISSGQGVEAWISQLGASFYVCLPLSGKGETTDQQEFHDQSVLTMTYRCHYIQIHGTLINNIVVLVNGKERILVNPGWPIVSAGTVRLPSFNVVVTLDLRGLVIIYAFNERSIKDEVSPLMKFNSIGDTERLAVVVSQDSLFLAVANVEGRLVVHDVSIQSITNEFNR